MADSSRLSPSDWIDAGLAALAARGVEAVRVDRLAKDLSVSRGSFYWHFKDRAALLAAMLGAWSDNQTAGIIEQAKALADKQGGSASATLLALLKLCFSDDGRLEKALRLWAEHDSEAAALVADVDARRIAYLASLLRDMGQATEKADTRARLAYRTWLGAYSVVQGPKAKEIDRDAEELHRLITA